jgi:hypothetical protein
MALFFHTYASCWLIFNPTLISHQAPSSYKYFPPSRPFSFIPSDPYHFLPKPLSWDIVSALDWPISLTIITGVAHLCWHSKTVPFCSTCMCLPGHATASGLPTPLSLWPLHFTLKFKCGGLWCYQTEAKLPHFENCPVRGRAILCEYGIQSQMDFQLCGFRQITSIE